ncbi:hypothetical protein KPL28_04750 [Clostridium algidicarnis]|uniref:hypothetical protein n=1 Tax=Clostridium algidicarnis TaxID=37659 RepID=UPI001C0DF3BB|nr:hypothetical protein [Clostridium algidicarnis]MBU3208950.1 hypothetical protein [Clostridium algidicarnis]
MSENINNILYEVYKLYEYRRLCSYMFFIKMWSKENIESWQKEYLERMKYNIENEIPYIEMDFKILEYDRVNGLGKTVFDFYNNERCKIT